MQSEEKCIFDFSSEAFSRISYAAVNMGAEAAAGLRVRVGESGTADGDFSHSASEGAPGLCTEQQTLHGAPLQAKTCVLRVLLLRLAQ